jgi:hypothetical protein
MCPVRTNKRWLAALDDFRNWLVRDAAKTLRILEL